MELVRSTKFRLRCNERRSRKNQCFDKLYHLERSYSDSISWGNNEYTRINQNASKNETRLHACSRNDFHFSTYFLCISRASVLYLNLGYAARSPKNYHVPDIRGFYKYVRRTWFDANRDTVAIRTYVIPPISRAFLSTKKNQLLWNLCHSFST